MFDRSRALWRKSTRSQGTGECVEVADNIPRTVAVRDSKDRTGPVLAFAHPSWSSFVAAIKDGQFDH